MERSEHVVEIAAPVERVFAWLTEPELMLQWVGGLREFRPLDPEPGAGARSEQVVELGGRRLDVSSELVRYEPDEAVEARLTGKGFELTTGYRLEARDAGTSLHATVDTRLHGLTGRVLGGVVEKHAQRKLKRDLATLKQLVEAEQA